MLGDAVTDELFQEHHDRGHNPKKKPGHRADSMTGLFFFLRASSGDYIRFSSTRRFIALPSGVLLSEMGWVSPYPLAVICDAGTPFLIR